MTEFFVELHSVNDVKQFVTMASMVPVDIDVSAGRYTVDAKSILGLCSLDLDRPVQVRVYGGDQEGADFRSSVQRMIVDAPEEA